MRIMNSTVLCSVIRNRSSHVISLGILTSATGQLLWRRSYSTEYTQNIITPILTGQTLIVSGYQKPISTLRIFRKNGQWATEVVWENTSAPFYMANAVIVGGSVFGLSHRNSGQYVLVDLKTGKTLWAGMPRQATNAAIVRAGDVVFSLEDDAELIVGRVNPTGFQELRRYTVSSAATWAEPVISGNRIIVKDISTLALWSLGFK
jgi:outer membrane protein assembly factor BamB